MRLAPLFIATSLATLLAGNMAAMGTAHAAGMDPKEVTTMLARSQVLDSRCKILSTNESQDLRDLVARAEIALAGKYSVTVARETLAKGRAEGKVAACDAAASAQVRDILNAGMQATTEAPAVAKPDQPVAAAPQPIAQPEPKAAATPIAPVEAKPEAKMAVVAAKPVAPKKIVVAQKPAALVKVKKKIPAVAAQSATQVTTEIKSKKKVSLASYSSLAEKYFVELKCHTLPLNSAKRMYANVLAQHRAAVASDGAPAVRKMLKGAQSRAGSQSCA
jgi:aminopeptidase N